MRMGFWSIQGSSTTSARPLSLSSPGPRSGAVTRARWRPRAAMSSPPSGRGRRLGGPAAIMTGRDGNVTSGPGRGGSLAEVTIGIDIGTTSVKAVAADAEGRVLARARIPHRLIVPEAGQMEHDAAQAWRRGPRRAFLAMAKAFPEARGVCVASMVPSMTAVDRRGIPRTPGLLYGDSRGANAKGPANPQGSFEAMEFVRWSAARLPDARGYWPAPAVANFALCGEAVVDPLTAGTTYPLFDGSRWDEGALARVGARLDQMPRVAPAHEAAAKVGDMAVSSGAIDAMG